MTTCESRVVTAHGIFNSNNTTQGEINMTAYTVRDAKIEDAQRILEIYAYYVENTASINCICVAAMR